MTNNELKRVATMAPNNMEQVQAEAEAQAQARAKAQAEAKTEAVSLLGRGASGYIVYGHGGRFWGRCRWTSAPQTYVHGICIRTYICIYI